ncbi:MAG: leucine--tRNA ligase [Actinomycetota bacterium]
MTVEDRYDPHSFEERWIKQWEGQRLNAAPPAPDARRKRYVLEMFPYPSGDMHMGHVENYSIADAIARYWRMMGHQILHPMGYDAFGLPAENAAIKRGIHPREWTYSNIERMRDSQTRLGFSYDWDRVIRSCDPEYYRWNQWIFLKLHERGLAYRKTAPVNWCPVDKTVLANEQISQGVCWRCGSVPEVRDLAQWFLKTTAYADRLLDDMGMLDWPEQVLTQQRNWIGRSRGVEVVFQVRGTRSDQVLDVPVFTTRPDTLWGATFFVMAPEHSFARMLVEGTEVADAYQTFLEEVRRETEIDRMATATPRKGMALPAVAINPVNGEEIPVWAADYVLMHYGTGAIMAVPAHDQRDFEFARQYDIPIRPVIQPEGVERDATAMQESYSGAGVMVDSGPFTGTTVFPDTGEGIDRVIAWLDEEGKGRGAVNYRLRDWLISRQRYWGTPIPMVHCPTCGVVPVPEDELPVLLPDEADYTPTEGTVGPLANVESWVNVACPQCGGERARRETDTMDTFFDSSWYFLRFCDPVDDHAPFDPQLVGAWSPIDQYVGGVEHAVMHLIYARFFTKVFQDMGLVSFPEPFLKLFNQGEIRMGGRGMSKSLGNVVEAAETVRRYGADAPRVFILFCSPPGAAYDFPEDGIEEIGRVAYSWLSRVWRLLSSVDDAPTPPDLERAVHRAVKGVSEDFETFGFNTAIAKLMELGNELARFGGNVPRTAAETFLKLLAPIAPFITEELWHRYGNEESIHLQAWPSYDRALLAEQPVTMVVQIDGKVRDRIEVTSTIGRDEMRARALGSEKVQRILGGRELAKVIVVPPKLVNLVTR